MSTNEAKLYRKILNDADARAEIGRTSDSQSQLETVVRLGEKFGLPVTLEGAKCFLSADPGHELSDEELELVAAAGSPLLPSGFDMTLPPGLDGMPGYFVDPDAGETLTGGEGDDSLTGGDKDDNITGMGGNDTLRGGGGDDWMEGDSLRGQVGFGLGPAAPGNDTMYGGDGNDSMFGNGGDDNMDGGTGNDSMDGGTGNDTMDGGTGNDLMAGGDGNDTMDGGAGNDRMSGGSGSDTMNGGAGDDHMSGGSGGDIMHGGDGDDYIDGGTGPDSLFGGAGNDHIVAGGGGSADGGVGDDRIIARGDSNVLTGGEGSDTFEIQGFNGNVITDFNFEEDTLLISAGYPDMSSLVVTTDGNGNTVVVWQSEPHLDDDGNITRTEGSLTLTGVELTQEQVLSACEVP